MLKRFLKVWFSTSMAVKPVCAASFVFALGLMLSILQPSTCQNVKGKVSCLDCTRHYDFSGIMVGVKCDGVRKISRVSTEENGAFEVELPSDSFNKLNCMAKLLGGPNQLYASRQTMTSKLIQTHGERSVTISTPLAFSTGCPKCRGNGVDSSKTVDLPLPKEWGLAPSSYYFPFFPIIGIP